MGFINTAFVKKQQNANTSNQFILEKNIQAIKVALLLDTSNSMDGLIDQAKAQLWEIVNQLSYAKCSDEKPQLGIALFEYGNDNLSAESGYLRKITGFTSDLDLLSKELFSLTTSGGSEYCGTVIKASINQLDWGNSSEDLKLIFIAGNEPFTQGSVDYRDAVIGAKEKDIVVNTIFCGDYHHGINSKWQDGALLSQGNYTAINHNKKTVYIVTPYDDVILQLNVKLNKTYIPYGNLGANKIALQESEDSNAISYSKANGVNRAISKSSHFYNNSSWDLVDAYEKDANLLEKIKKEELPTNLKSFTKAQLKEYIKLQQQLRKETQEEISKINADRLKYLSKAENKVDNQLQNALINAIKTQAEKKNFTWH